MNLSRSVIVVLPTVLCCLDFAQLVTPFCQSPLFHSHKSILKLSVASQVVEEEEKSLEDLMDEAVLLYSVTSRRERFNDNTEAERDILKLRGNELSAVIEDAVFNACGVERDEVATTVNNMGETPTEPETLFEISQALDKQILLGYEATFNEAELEIWIAGIETLQQKLETQLKALPPGSDWATENPEATAPKPPTPLEKIHDRLETMRTLIDPEGCDRLRPPLAKVLTVPSIQYDDIIVQQDLASSSHESNTETDESKNNATEEENEISKLDIENAFIESIDKASSSESRNVANDTSNIENVDKPGDNGFIEAEVAPVTSTEPMTATEVIFESESHVTETTEEEKNHASELDLENALIESMNKAAEEEAYTKRTDGTDVVSTVVTAAALGAAAVTKLPIVLTGVALGPIIRDSISYAKGRAKQAAQNKKVSKPKPKPKAKPKAWSAFDPKPHEKREGNTQAESESGEKES